MLHKLCSNACASACRVHSKLQQLHLLSSCKVPRHSCAYQAVVLIAYKNKTVGRSQLRLHTGSCELESMQKCKWHAQQQHDKCGYMTVKVTASYHASNIAAETSSFAR